MKAVLCFGILCVMLVSVNCAQDGGWQREYNFQYLGSCPGCIEEMPTNDLTVRQLAFYVLGELGPWHPQLIKIQRANRQVVNGTKYFLWLKILKFGHVKHCRATVWDKSDGTRELTSTTCWN